MLPELNWLLMTRIWNSNVEWFLYPKANQVRPQTTFGQEMPLLLNSSGISSGNGSETSRSQSTGPPILPPHLLQVILNKVRGPLTQKRWSLKTKAHSLRKKFCTMIPFSKNDSWCQLWLGWKGLVRMIPFSKNEDRAELFTQWMDFS